MRKAAEKLYRNSTLAAKIRFSYLIILLPVLVFILVTYYQFWQVNSRYDAMVDSVVAASQFSLDFKKDFDYEAYLLIVGNKEPEESELPDLLSSAQDVIDSLKGLTTNKKSAERLASAEKYLKNLYDYVERINENLAKDDNYEENITIWENDVQIVTQLLQDTVFEYIYYEVRQLQSEKENYRQAFITTVEILGIALFVILLLILVLSYYIPRSITKPVTKLRDVTLKVAGGDLSVRSDVIAGRELTELSNSMNSMIDEINELIGKVTKDQSRLRKAEFELLQAQINPHFLYNTLDAIVWLAEAHEWEKVIEMVQNLSEFFRTSLSKGRDIITLKEELQHVGSYLEIQKVRYRDILKFDINVPEEFSEVKIPKITLQPLAENAIYHGIKNRRGGGTIRIGAYSEDNSLVITVTDDGAGMTMERLLEVRRGLSPAPEGDEQSAASGAARFSDSPDANIVSSSTVKLSGSSPYGLYNVNERIRLNFGDEYGLIIDSDLEDGTVVLVRLPYPST